MDKKNTLIAAGFTLFTLFTPSATLLLQCWPATATTMGQNSNSKFLMGLKIQPPLGGDIACQVRAACWEIGDIQ